MTIEQHQETKTQEFARRKLKELKKEHPDAEEYQKALRKLIGDLKWFQDVESAIRSEDFSQQARGKEMIRDDVRYEHLAAEYGLGLTPDELKNLIEDLQQQLA